MESEKNLPPKKRRVRKILLWILSIFFILVVIVGFFLYRNFNRLVSEALIKSFNSNIISDVYELKFEKLSINVLDGDIKVSNVTLQPRKTPLRNYPYINSTLQLTTKKLKLENVDLRALLKHHSLILDKIEITNPDIQLHLSGEKYLLFPFKDTTGVTKKTGKKSIDSFLLHEFDLIDASIHVKNEREQREFDIRGWNISLDDLALGQGIGEYLIALKKVDLQIGECTGNMKKGGLKRLYFKDFKITVEDLDFQKTLDTLTYQFNDFTAGVNALDIQTADSMFHMTMQSFDLSYKDRSIKIAGVSFKPNISNAELQKRKRYQHVTASGSVGSIHIQQLNFDSLLYHDKIYIDEILLDKVHATIFKDKTKPLDPNKFPEYFGQQLKKVKMPLLVKHVKATNVSIENSEKKPDGNYAKVTVNRGTADISNITNMPGYKALVMDAGAFLENKVHFKLLLHFSYLKPEFTMDGRLKKFSFSDLNHLLHEYTPAKINKGVVDEIRFSGTAFKTGSNGTMEFLYHDLEIDLELHDQAKWKSSLITFAANSLIASSNPVIHGQPPKIVQFKVERDMNKGFINIILKSLLNGLKETIIMTKKENRKAYKEAKKQSKGKDK